jgi:hypothetical protein
MVPIYREVAVNFIIMLVMIEGVVFTHIMLKIFEEIHLTFSTNRSIVRIGRSLRQCKHTSKVVARWIKIVHTLMDGKNKNTTQNIIRRNIARMELTAWKKIGNALIIIKMKMTIKSKSKILIYYQRTAK